LTNLSDASIGQLLIPVENLERGVAFYRDVLGLPFLFQAPPQMAFFQCGAVRLLVGVPPPGQTAQRGSAIYFAVKDIHGVFASLTGSGVRFTVIQTSGESVSQTSATKIYLNYITNDSIAVNLKTFFQQRVKVGDTFYFQDKDDVAKWRLFELTGDRVGAVVFDDLEQAIFRPHRSRAQVLRILEAIVQKNRTLRADSDVRPAPGMLNRVLESARGLVGHDHVVIIASDFDGADDETHRLVAELAEHNDVMAMLVHDPASREFPARGRVVVTGGELQVQVDAGRAGEREAVLAVAQERVRPILQWTRELGVPVMPLSTGEDVATQVGSLLGAALVRRRV
jgi:catechol 2,3-dioxygenase-like lactoylglutathione lyase family enzyme